MTAEVVYLAGRRRRKKDEYPCPDKLTPEQLGSVLRFALRNGYSYERVQFAWMTVRSWWEMREIQKKDWAAVTRNALLHFWGKNGYPDWMARRAWKGPEHQLTSDLIERIVKKYRESCE